MDIPSSPSKLLQVERKFMDKIPRNDRLLNRKGSPLGLTLEELDDRGFLEGGVSVPNYYTSLRQRNRRYLEMKHRTSRLRDRGKIEIISKVSKNLAHMLRVVIRRGIRVQDYCVQKDVKGKGSLPFSVLVAIIHDVGFPFTLKQIQEVLKPYISDHNQVGTESKVDYKAFFRNSGIEYENSRANLNLDEDESFDGATNGATTVADISSFAYLFEDMKTSLLNVLQSSLHRSIDDIYRMFARWDIHGLGEITVTQFFRVLQRLHVPPLSDQDQDYLVELLDVNQNGRVDFEGLLSYCFDDLLCNSSGTKSLALTRQGHEQVRRVIRESPLKSLEDRRVQPSLLAATGRSARVVPRPHTASSYRRVTGPLSPDERVTKPELVAVHSTRAAVLAVEGHAGDGRSPRPTEDGDGRPSTQHGARRPVTATARCPPYSYLSPPGDGHDGLRTGMDGSARWSHVPSDGLNADLSIPEEDPDDLDLVDVDVDEIEDSDQDPSPPSDRQPRILSEKTHPSLSVRSVGRGMSENNLLKSGVGGGGSGGGLTPVSPWDSNGDPIDPMSDAGEENGSAKPSALKRPQTASGYPTASHGAAAAKPSRPSVTILVPPEEERPFSNEPYPRLGVENAQTDRWRKRTLDVVAQGLTALRESVLKQCRKGTNLKSLFDRRFDRLRCGRMTVADLRHAMDGIRWQLTHEEAEKMLDEIAVDQEEPMESDASPTSASSLEERPQNDIRGATFGEFAVFVTDELQNELVAKVQNELASLLLKNRGGFHEWLCSEELWFKHMTMVEVESLAQPPVRRLYPASGPVMIAYEAFLIGLDKLGLGLSARDLGRLATRFDLRGEGQECCLSRFLSLVTDRSVSWYRANVTLEYHDLAQEECQEALKALEEGRPLVPGVQADVIRMAAYLGIRVLSEPHLLHIASDAAYAPVPSGWEVLWNKASGGAIYVNRLLSTSSWEHPLDPYFRRQRDFERFDEEGNIRSEWRTDLILRTRLHGLRGLSPGPESRRPVSADPYGQFSAARAGLPLTAARSSSPYLEQVRELPVRARPAWHGKSPTRSLRSEPRPVSVLRATSAPFHREVPPPRPAFPGVFTGLRSPEVGDTHVSDHVEGGTGPPWQQPSGPVLVTKERREAALQGVVKSYGRQGKKTGPPIRRSGAAAGRVIAGGAAPPRSQQCYRDSAPSVIDRLYGRDVIQKIIEDSKRVEAVSFNSLTGVGGTPSQRIQSTAGVKDGKALTSSRSSFCGRDHRLASMYQDDLLNNLDAIILGERSRNPDSEKTKEADVAAAERSAEELGGKEVKSRFADASSTGTQLSNRRPREPRGSIVLL